jgi:hypothetical protein
LSSFYGIRISIRPRETNHPLPHFHARYSEFSASISIETLEVLAGSLPARALEMVLAWGALHRAELLTAWGGTACGTLASEDCSA